MVGAKGFILLICTRVVAVPLLLISSDVQAAT